MACLIMDTTSGFNQLPADPRATFALFESKYPEDAALVKKIVDALVGYFLEKIAEARDLQ